MELKNYHQKIKDERRLRISMARIARRQCTMAVPAAMVVTLFWTFAVQIMHISTAAPRRLMEAPPPPVREYDSNGYLMVSPNGGLNQMRAGICDMVAVARYMNATLVVPHLDNTSFWQDQSQFEDIFQVNHFINSLTDEVKIVRHLPPDIQTKLEMQKLVSMPPISWSNISYYTNKILPEKLKRNEILHFEKTDNRLANNGPLELQKLRCKVNYRALKFSRKLENMGTKIVNILRKRGKFLVLHLRYEKDMLAYTGCNQGCTSEESQQLQNLRYSVPWWKKKDINSTSTRLDGLCPLTPEETALTLKALGINRKTQIYIAAGDIYGGERRLAALRSAYPNLVTKETLLQASDLVPFKNYTSQVAAIDYIVSLESDIFFPTYGGNMARLVEGHRRYLGFRKTIQPNHKALVDLIDKYRRNRKWKEFELGVKKAQENRYGNPEKRKVIPDKPREEDYFWSNPYECLPPIQDNFKL